MGSMEIFLACVWMQSKAFYDIPFCTGAISIIEFVFWCMSFTAWGDRGGGIVGLKNPEYT